MRSVRLIAAGLAASTLYLLIGESPGGVAARQPSQPTPQATELQRVYAPLPAAEHWSDAELVVNNNSPETMVVSPTLFSEGQSVAGNPITLLPSEPRWMSVRELLPSQGAHLKSLDGIELTYRGKPLEVGAQLTLLRAVPAGSADAMFTAVMDYKSSVQEAVWWTPRGGQGRDRGGKRH